MFHIARLQMLDGFQDAKFIFFALLVVGTFFLNGVVYSEQYHQEQSDYDFTQADLNRDLEEAAANLQRLAIFEQRFMRPPSPLLFIADGGSRFLPNVVAMDAFARYEVQQSQRTNDFIAVLPAVDWSFIIGVEMSLLALLLSFSTVAGERRDGTLRAVLANPVSRLALFGGKFLGLLAVVVFTLIVGIIVNLIVLAFIGSIPLGPGLLWPVAWALLTGILYLSLFLLAGIAVSSLTSNPAVALVVMLMVWVVVIVILPGAARLLVEYTVRVPSQAETGEELERVRESARENAPPIAGRWTGNPFDDHVPLRARMYSEMTEESQKVRDRRTSAQLEQSRLIEAASAISPYALFSNALKKVCSTGDYGFERLIRDAERFRIILHDFVVERDRLDADTPHLVYSSGRNSADRGTFSRKEVPFSAVPAQREFFSGAGITRSDAVPAMETIILLAIALVLGIGAFFALMRCDPR